jgi:outer membrane lipoprotein SlyB
VASSFRTKRKIVMSPVHRLSFVSVLGVVALAACTPQPGPSTFSQGETMRAQPVQFGTVESVRPVTIRPGQTRLGAVTGAVVGGVAGTALGNNTASRVVGGTTGAVAGGAAGSALQGSQRTNGVELTVELDNGTMIAVVQPGDPRDFRQGDRVRVTGEGENVRITR